MRAIIVASALLGALFSAASPASAAAATQITAFTAAQGKDGRIAVTGRLLRADGTPVARADVEVSYAASRSAGDAMTEVLVTGNDGGFALRGQSPHNGYWQAVFAGSGADAPSATPRRWLRVRFYTRIVSFNASATKARRTVQVVGGLQGFHGSPVLVGDWKALRGRVSVYFRAKGTRTFRWKAFATTNAKGKFRKAVTSGDGTWVVRFTGADNYLTSATRTDYVNAR